MFVAKPNGVPVFVMLPLDTVNSDGVFKYAGSPWFSQSLYLLATSGAYGVAVDVWWGAVERAPGQYSWTGYRQLFELVKQTGLKLQIVLSCHACGGNVGDTAHIPLPSWVLKCGENDPDLFFTDRPREGSSGQRNREYLSVWADLAPRILCGRSPMQCYEDFMQSFHDNFTQELGSLVEEVVVGAGPCGELRFPSYVEANGWRFPGVGEFQCYDRRALASLAQAARDAGHAGWGYGGPHDAGDYNSHPEETGFYGCGGSWDTAYGRFFLAWYSGSLLAHGDRLMAAARRIFGSVGMGTSSAGLQRVPSRGGSGSMPHKGSNPSSEASTDTRMASPLVMAPQQGQALFGGSLLGSTGPGQPGGAGASSSSGYDREGGAGPGPFAGQPNNIEGSRGNSGAQVPVLGGPATGVSERLLDVGEADHSDVSMSMDPEQDLEGLVCMEGEHCQRSGGRRSQDDSAPGVSGRAAAGAAGSSGARPPPGSHGGSHQHHSGGSNIGVNSSSHAHASSQQPAPPLSQSPSSGADMGSMAQLLADEEQDGGASECMTPDTQGGGCAADELGGIGIGAALRSLPGRLLASDPDLRLGQLSMGGGGMAGGVTLTLKIAGIHWWFRSRSHAAELTAGYYNTATRDGYGPIVELCVKHSFSLTLTCVEMCDTQHPPPALCGPEGLLKQVRGLCAQRGVPLSGENALPIFLMDSVDSTALERVVFNTRVWHGAAIMAAYWNARGQRQLARALPHSPDTTMHNGALFYEASNGRMVGVGYAGMGAGLPHANPGGRLYFAGPTGIVEDAGPSDHHRHHRHHAGGSGAGSVSTSAAQLACSTRLSDCGDERGGFSSADNSRSRNGRTCLMCPTHSDPAIAATGLRADSYADISEPLPPMRSFTFLRLASQILQPQYQGPWMKFMWKMREGGFC